MRKDEVRRYLEGHAPSKPMRYFTWSRAEGQREFSDVNLWRQHWESISDDPNARWWTLP